MLLSFFLMVPQNLIVAEEREQTRIEENAHVNTKESVIEDELSEQADVKVKEEDGTTEMKESEGKNTTEMGLRSTDEINEQWQGVVFGESTSSSKYVIEPFEQGVRLASTNNGGKFQSSGSDGLTYYYHPVPKDTNFSLKARINVESWTYTNAQEGFAVMLRDSVPEDNLFGQSFYSNSFAILGSRIEYTWNSELQDVVSSKGNNYTMRLGLGTRAITGITPDSPTVAPAPGSVLVETTPLEVSAGLQGKESGSYNIFGNGSGNLFPATDHITAVDVELKKTNTGLEAYYYDTVTGEELASTIMYDWQKLYQSESENVYLGFAAARNMTIKVEGIQLSYSDPKTDPPAEDRPNKIIEPVYTVTSSSHTGNKDHTLSFKANADGLLKVTDQTTMEVLEHGKDIPVTANREVQVPTTLTQGTNQFLFTFIPDKNFPPEEYTVMENYDAKEIQHSVDYQEPRFSTVYVTPSGLDSGSGSKQNPLSIHQALKYANPGQIIVLSPGKYLLEQGLTIPKGIDGTSENPVFLLAEKNDKGERPIFDFGGIGNGMTVFGNHWVLRGFDVTNSAPMQKGMQISGSDNLIEDINAYRNGNTGIQISGSSSDSFEEWPANNLVKNCTSFENADPGFEDADGFAAKLTIGEGNVFDGCIAYHNADDGWDLFAKNETGSIGKVVIKNSVAYRNGWVPGLTGEGNGNGFKMGGSSLSGPHELINSLSFENLAKGIDSNSGTDIKVKSSTSFNNGSYNIAFYTSSAPETDFYGTGILSFRTENLEMQEQIKPLKQKDSQLYHSLNYYWNPTNRQSENSEGQIVSEQWFESLETKETQPISRYVNGSINVHGLMQVKAEYRLSSRSNQGIPESVGATFTDNLSPASAYPDYKLADERLPDQTKPTEQNNPIQILSANGITENAEKQILETKAFTMYVSTFSGYQGEPILDDTRYTPVTWEITETNLNGKLDGEPITITAPQKGDYTIVVTYRAEIYDGENWLAYDEQVTQEKPITVLGITQKPATPEEPTKESKPEEVEESDSEDETNQPSDEEKDLPKTGTVVNSSLILIGGIIVIGVGVYKLISKRNNRAES
jgi:LPXTG-motif cell wall-anchored protein